MCGIAAIYKTKPKCYFEGENEAILNYLPNHLSLVLDVGCSAGGFGKLLKDKGLTVWGIEPIAHAANQAKSKIDHVINDIFDEKILNIIQDQKFDCIFFIDVLEHMVDPYSAINFSKKILKSNGYIISSIPNVLRYSNILNILKKQDWEYVEAGIMDKGHLRFFSKKSITRLFKESGFTILTMDGINPHCNTIFKLLNFLFLNKFEDMKYTGFITVARKNELEEPS